MKWRKKRDGGTFYRHDVWYAKRKGVTYTVTQSHIGWYVTAWGKDIREIANSAWEGYGCHYFATPEDGMAWAEIWTPNWSIR